MFIIGMNIMKIHYQLLMNLKEDIIIGLMIIQLMNNIMDLLSLKILILKKYYLLVVNQKNLKLFKYFFIN